MRRIILLLTLSYLAQISKAQPVLDTLPWCPPGATWVYLVSCRTCNLYYELSYEKDTIVLGYDTKKLNTRLIELNGFNLSFRKVTNLNPEFLVKTGDSISIIDSGQVKLLYKVKATIGEKYEIHIVRQVCQSGQSVSFTDSVVIGTPNGNDTIDNIEYKNFTQVGLRYSINNIIIENIGPKTTFFNGLRYAFCPEVKATFGLDYESNIQWLACYSDSLRGNVMFNKNQSSGLFSCHSIKTSITENPLLKSSLAIFPNPTNGKITIEIKDDTPIKVILYNMIGKRIVEKSLQENYTTFNNISSGVYLIHVIGESKKIYQQKLIID